jgi:two-component sensor histidine kinase
LQGEGLPPDQLLLELQQLNQELRAVHESVRRETLTESHNLYLSHDLTLNLQTPIHEILYEVYSTTLERKFPCFKGIKVKVVKFNPLEERHLKLEHKRGLCRFLEEALCNVGKHATGVTRLQVICTQEQDQQIIRVIDNGIGIGSISEQYKPDLVKGRGTQQAQDLARQLGGKFQRSPHLPTGTVCELIWPLRKPWFWQIFRL